MPCALWNSSTGYTPGRRVSDESRAMMASMNPADTERAREAGHAARGPLGVRARGLVKRVGAEADVRGIERALPARGG